MEPESQSSLSITLPISDAPATGRTDRDSTAAGRVAHLKLNTLSTLALLVMVTLLAYLTSEYLLEALTALVAEVWPTGRTKNGRLYAHLIRLTDFSW